MMSDAANPHEKLLARVAEQLFSTSSATDHLMLTKWRVLSICQYMLGGPASEIEVVCGKALDCFATNGPGLATDKAIEGATEAIRDRDSGTQSILPTISKTKRIAVTNELDLLAAAGALTIERAARALPSVRQRLASATNRMLSGTRYRLDLVAAVVEDSSRSEEERARAGAAVLYVDEIRDVIPDTFGVIGMFDDDYALRVVLEEVGENQPGACLHWSERISLLWDDLPFLQGVNLQRGDRPISVTWLDRVNSYISYCHVLGQEREPLFLLQPSIACSPLHAIVSLIGLLVLDAMTSSQIKAQNLRAGQTYEVDGFFVQFEGLAGPPRQGWLRLRGRDGVVPRPPEWAHRMIPIEKCRLSSLRDFPDLRASSTDPVQRFFHWDAAIGSTSIPSRLVVVTSRQRGLDLLEGVQSNGVRLMDHGLVRFLGASPVGVETEGALILVVPSLGAARLLAETGVRLQAILVDGYDRLDHGRHELPFLINMEGAPPIVTWSAAGYAPSSPPAWLPRHRYLEVSSDDLVAILELDDVNTDPGQLSLWEAATGTNIQPRVMEGPASECAVVKALDDYLAAVRSCQDLPEYWQYHLTMLAKTLRLLVAATPAEWSEITRFTSSWSASLDKKWASLRPSAVVALSSLRDLEMRVIKAVSQVPDNTNSRAAGLQMFLLEKAATEEHWYFACDRPEQVRAVAALVQRLGLRNIEPVLLRDLAVCSSCLVAGWLSVSFARRLWAHTPRAIVALVDETDGHRWEQIAGGLRHPGTRSLLGAVGGSRPTPASFSAPVFDEEDHESQGRTVEPSLAERTPCVFLWVAGEVDAKVLAREGRVVVEEGDAVRDRVAARVSPGDRVILGPGDGRWSPADEFTEAVVNAVETSNPTLVRAAQEWRKALHRLQEAERVSLSQLRARLAAVGVQREGQTIEGWLEVDRVSPIAPRSVHTELVALWPLIEQHSEVSRDEVVSACIRLRSLRAGAGRALLQVWKGRPVDLGVDQARIEDLVERLRQEVQVYDVDAVTCGEVPSAMLGWWISPGFASRFEADGTQAQCVGELEGEEDLELI